MYDDPTRPIYEQPKTYVKALAITAIVLDVVILFMLIVGLANIDYATGAQVFGVILWFLALGLGIVCEIMSIMQLNGTQNRGVLGNGLKILLLIAVIFRTVLCLLFIIGLIILFDNDDIYIEGGLGLFWFIILILFLDFGIFIAYGVVYLMNYQSIIRISRNRAGMLGESQNNQYYQGIQGGQGGYTAPPPQYLAQYPPPPPPQTVTPNGPPPPQHPHQVTYPVGYQHPQTPASNSRPYAV